MLCTCVRVSFFFNRHSLTQEVARLFTVLFCDALVDEGDDDDVDLPLLCPLEFPSALHVAITTAEAKIRKAAEQL